MNVSLPFALSMVTLLIVVAGAYFLLKQNHASQRKRGEQPGGVAGPTDPSGS